MVHYQWSLLGTEPMREQTVIVWDLETIPDLEAAARALDMSGSTAEEVRSALGSEFPKYPLHKIACVGALVSSRGPFGWQVDALGAPHIGDRSEADLIRAFVQKVGQLRPQLVTFNGNTFDLPVLRYRAMINRVSAAGLLTRQYFHRYTDDAVDLCDVLASFESRGKVKLDFLMKVLNMSGKPTGVDGSQVETLVNAGRIIEVAQYCESDVMNTYRAWLVYELFRGSINEEQFAWSETQLREFIIGRKSGNLHLVSALG
jgi:predicted PolB exonuclease-like 3'-5' exonuclease